MLTVSPKTDVEGLADARRPAASPRAGAPAHTIWDRPGYLVRRLHQIHVAMFLAKVAQGEVTPIQYGLLSILVSRPNIDQFTIGEELGLDPANVTDILKRLESRKLVSRVVDPANRRRKLCLATARGAAFVKKYDQDMHDSQNELLAPLAPAERRVFMDLLSRLVEGNNDSGRTSLRPGGLALDVNKARRTAKAAAKATVPAAKPASRPATSSTRPVTAKQPRTRPRSSG